MQHVNKRRNVLILVILSISLLTNLFLGYSNYKNTSTFKDSLPWSNNFILTFNNHEYNVTYQTTTDVGNKIEIITFHGWDSGSYSLYAINNSKNNDRIAVKTKLGFLIATIKPY